MTVTYGLRWEYNPVPSATDGPQPFTVNQVHDFSTMALAPAGTSLWHAQKHDFAPRLGIAWNPRPNLVIRAGAGIFYDLGYSLIASVASAFPYVQQKCQSHQSAVPDRRPALDPAGELRGKNGWGWR